MDPYFHDFRGISGYCVLTLKISLWALYWSFQPNDVKIPYPIIPYWLPSWPFNPELARGFLTLLWVVLIGADADTYGASCGPLLAAYHPEIPECLLEGLQVRDKIEKIFTEVFAEPK